MLTLSKADNLLPTYIEGLFSKIEKLQKTVYSVYTEANQNNQKAISKLNKIEKNIIKIGGSLQEQDESVSLKLFICISY